MSLEQLKNPPIEEVVCGIIFDPVPQLDPLTIGWFAREVAAEYPRHQVQPAIADGGTVFVGATTPLRAWLISAADDLLLQVQHDRFYLNWRARGQEYPRCGDHEGKLGILSQAIEEFSRFRRFLADEFAVEPKVRRLELSKVDHLVQGRDWSDEADIVDMLPVLRPLVGLSANASSAGAAAQLIETDERSQLILSISPIQERRSAEGKTRRVVIVETRVTADRSSSDDLVQEFQNHNKRLNEVFERLIPEDQRADRFGKAGEHE